MSALACCALSACAHHPRNRPDPNESPEAFLERQLISRAKGEINKPTADGGMLFYAEFNATNRYPLRLPFDVLKAHCESQGGEWVESGAPNVSSESLAAPTAPPHVLDALADADGRVIFGKFRCESNQAVWTAEIEPSAFSPTDASDVWQLELFLKAYVGSELPTPPNAPPPGAAGEAPPTAPPTAAADVSPLNQQTLRPPSTGDKWLADPHPFSLDMGSDSPDVLGAKLHVDPAASSCKAAADTAAKPEKPTKKAKVAAPAAPSLSELCWDHPGAGEALELRARFADLGQGPVLASFEVHYPAESFAWLEHSMRNDWGPADAHGDRDTAHSWSWLHTVVELSHANDDAAQETIVRVQHRPTLARAQLPAGNPGREQPAVARVATPWQLQLGFEHAQTAQAKLQTAGFTIAANGCVDAGEHALPMLTRVCTLSGGKMDGLRSASVITVDMGDGRARIAKLEYTFEKRVLDETLTELRTQYGNPIPVAGDALQWWTGGVGIEVVPSTDTFALRYFHGRLLQLHVDVVERNQVGNKAMQHQGL